ncbi:MAG TPA: iron-sulfur cluster insertion protein ErpA [Ghiorsea sp.]|nr:iron-sulfur cluster insertion protein ErpA [Ghiorsea sp.]HIP07399.1 iron-sulfur cluster insertion protein ErpA [Mariprofundaceae bacterium]
MSVSLTENAAVKIGSLLESEENKGLKLRIFVSGGGCSGFEYGFTFDDEIKDNDTVVENFGVGLIVDQMSMEMLKGSEVDYQTSLQGESFVIKNPNAGSTCGCGKSFTPADEGAGCGHASAEY